MVGAAALAALFVARVQLGTSSAFDLGIGDAFRALLATLGLGDPLPDLDQVVARGRIIDGATAALVGASLAVSGALLQGLFRNPLASPGLVGVTSGASLGAVLGLLAIGGVTDELLGGRDDLLVAAASNAPVVVTGSAFFGALLVAVFVMLLASRGGRVSVPTLLLVGVAVNACLGGILAAVQDVLVRDNWGVAQSLFRWLFGSLTDRTAVQVLIAAVGLGLALLAVPLVSRELDLFAGGEDTASSLGVSVGRTKLLALGAASISAATAVSVAGQIAFVGLVVPHLVRQGFGARHAHVLPLSALGGAVLLLGAECANLALLGPARLQPGPVLSLIGGPFFLGLLLARRREVATW